MTGASVGHFTIKAVAQATGLTVETLRAWERRYEVVRPTRDSSGRRTYSAADVARLRLLRSATELGHTISRLASLPDEDLAKLVANSGGVEEVLTTAIALLPPNEVIHAVIAPLVREIGDRWHRGEVTIAQEHMVTDIVRRLVISVARGYLRADNGPCLVLATLSGERHELGILMCSWLAATRRYHTHYLGADCPASEIARFALEVDARAVLISLVMPENQVPVMEQLQELAGLLRGKCEVWIGGFAARQLAAEQVPMGCVLLPGPHDFEQRLDLMTAERFA